MSEMSHTEKDPNPNRLGWGFAAAIILLAVIANVAAFSIHKATYLKPDKPASASVGH